MTNARWQRWLVAWHGVLVLVWLQGFWQRSVPLALAGLVAVPLLSRLTMLPQFLLMAWVCRHDAAPRLGAARLLRAWWAESRWAALVFGWWQPFRMHAVPDWLPPRAADRPAPRGVVLVHGFLCNRAFWTPWFAPLRARGHAFVAVTLEPAFGSIDDYAPAIEAAVRRVTEATGQAPLIVGHSMGGLAIRAWLRATPDGLPPMRAASPASRCACTAPGCSSLRRTSRPRAGRCSGAGTATATTPSIPRLPPRWRARTTASSPAWRMWSWPLTHACWPIAWN